MVWEKYRGFINVPKWVKETVEAIESAHVEERYFCKLCGFSVIMPMDADIRLAVGSNGQTGFLVGQKNYMGRHLGVNDYDNSRMRGCPFHPDVELTRTAYKRNA